MNIMLIAATGAEVALTLAYLMERWAKTAEGSFHQGNISIRVLITGVGITATTYHMTKALATERFDLLLMAGIAGAYDRSISLGELVFVTKEVLGDLGAEDGYNFLDVFDLALQPPDAPPFNGKWLTNPTDNLPLHIDLQQVSGLTCNTVTGTSFTALERGKKYNPQIESMEGAALHYVALLENIPFAQVRSISNYVGKRDRASWEIELAVSNLNKWLINLLNTF